MTGTYVPGNNFTVTVGARVKLNDAFGVTFPPILLEVRQKNIPANEATDALASAVSTVRNLIFIIDEATQTAVINPAVESYIIDEVSAERQLGPIESGL